VLRRDQDVVDALGFDLSSNLGVLNDNLRFAVGSQPRDFSVMSLGSHQFSDGVGKIVGVGEESSSIPLVGGVTEHESLISGAHVVDVLLGVHGVGNLGRLSFELQEHVAVVAVEADVNRGVADFLADSPGNGFVVD